MFMPVLMCPLNKAGFPQTTYGIDAYTVSLFKFNDVNVAPTTGTATKDTVKPSRVLTSGGANGRYMSHHCSGSSIYSDGSGWYGPSADNDYIFAGDYSIDFWFVVNGTAAGYSGPILSKPAPGAGGYSPWLIYQQSSQIQFYASSNNSSWDISSGAVFGTVAAGSWYHVAVCKQGSNYHLFLNGVYAGGFGSAATPMQTNDPIRIGQRPGLDSWGGYIDELRFSKGIARWVGPSNFSPPNQGYYGVLNGGNDAATVLLLHFDGTSGATLTGTDSAIGQTKGSPHVFTVVGTPTFQANAKFGQASGYFNGSPTTTRIYTPDTFFDTNPSYGNFTVDFWYMRLTSPAGFTAAIQKRNSSGQIACYSIGDDGTNMVLYASQSGSAWDLANPLSFGVPTLNTWVHFAMQRGPLYNQFRMFRNGVVAFSNDGWTLNNYFYQTNYPLQIGGLDDGFGMNALIDEVRFSNVARFPVGGFTPPAAPYQPP